MADIESIAKGLGIVLDITDAILIKKKLNKLFSGSGGKTASSEDIKKAIKATVKKPNMLDVAGSIRPNKKPSKSGKDMIRTKTLGKQGKQEYSKGGSVKTYSKGSGVRVATNTD